MLGYDLKLYSEPQYLLKASSISLGLYIFQSVLGSRRYAIFCFAIFSFSSLPALFP